MTLLEECKALVDSWGRLCREEWGSGVISRYAEGLRAVIARHEHDDWKGPWKCDEEMRDNFETVREVNARRGAV